MAGRASFGRLLRLRAGLYHTAILPEGPKVQTSVAPPTVAVMLGGPCIWTGGVADRKDRQL